MADFMLLISIIGTFTKMRLFCIIKILSRANHFNRYDDIIDTSLKSLILGLIEFKSQ